MRRPPRMRQSTLARAQPGAQRNSWHCTSGAAADGTSSSARMRRPSNAATMRTLCRTPQVWSEDSCVLAIQCRGRCTRVPRIIAAVNCMVCPQMPTQTLARPSRKDHDSTGGSKLFKWWQLAWQAWRRLAYEEMFAAPRQMDHRRAPRAYIGRPCLSPHS
jgi:hypothetical protein